MENYISGVWNAVIGVRVDVIEPPSKEPLKTSFLNFYENNNLCVKELSISSRHKKLISCLTFRWKFRGTW
jgi:hypothetical protein